MNAKYAINHTGCENMKKINENKEQKDKQNKQEKNNQNINNSTKAKSNVLIGLQYGDEGKARVLDKLAKQSHVIARFNGGANAGHSLHVGDKKIVLHQIPSGIFYPNSILYIGCGCVVNPLKIKHEIKDINNNDICIKNRLKISSKATLVQPHHTVLDSLHGKTIGTTKNGIGHAYSDQAIRSKGNQLKNLRFGDYCADPNKAKEIALTNLNEAIAENKLTDVNAKEMVEEFHKEMLNLIQYHCNDPLYLEKLAEQNKNIFFEGAQSVMLDVITGTVPFVTSSRTLSAAAYTGGDLSMRHHNKTIGVAKAIMSRVGNGPFVSEFGGERSEAYCAKDGGNAHKSKFEKANHNVDNILKSKDQFEMGIGLRMLGGEYGATTKRPRRIGMLDLVMLRQNCKLNSVDELYINKFDCLEHFNKTSLPGIPLVVAYELDGKEIDFMPANVEESKRAKPVITHLPHITTDISQIRDPKKLPKEVNKLISFIEEFTGSKMYGIGVGPERDQFIQLREHEN